MILFYLLFLTFIVLLFIGGYDATMRLVAYIDLNTRYKILKLRMWFFKNKIKKDILKQQKELNKSKENSNVR